MPAVHSLTCPACGAQVNTAEDRSHAWCDYCGGNFSIEESRDGLSLRIAEQMNETIAVNTERTINSVTDESQKIQGHLEKLELRQERFQISQQLAGAGENVRKAEGELYALMRLPKKTRATKQRIQLLQYTFIPQLRQQAGALEHRMMEIDATLNPQPVAPEPARQAQVHAARKRAKWITPVIVVCILAAGSCAACVGLSFLSTLMSQ